VTTASLDMRPRLPAVDAPYGGFANAVLFGNRPLLAALRNKLADSKNILFGKKCSAVSLSKKIYSAPFFDHVGNIIGLTSKPQMRRIDAGAIITSMAHAHIFRDGPYKKFIGHSVSLAHFPVKEKLPVAVLISASPPCPAVVRYRNLAHKSVLWSTHIFGLLRNYSNRPVYQGIGAK